ncbi:MAG: Rv2175c family DNA-binding protein [Angustibacter sp.]
MPTAEELDALLGPWVYVPDLCDQLDLDPVEVRRLITEGRLLAIRRGTPPVLSIPSRLIGPEGLLEELPGTITVLADAGLDREEILLWLFTPDDSIHGGSPIAAIQAGHKTEVRRRAQALAL